MTVYVDDMACPYGRMIMFHMIADADDELHAMADLIGVSRRWWQSPVRTSGSHYDICKAKRERAIRAGAVEITLRQAAAMNFRRRISGSLGTPDEALEWIAAYRREKRGAMVWN